MSSNKQMLSALVKSEAWSQSFGAVKLYIDGPDTEFAGNLDLLPKVAVLSLPDGRSLTFYVQPRRVHQELKVSGRITDIADRTGEFSDEEVLACIAYATEHISGIKRAYVKDIVDVSAAPSFKQFDLANFQLQFDDCLAEYSVTAAIIRNVSKDAAAQGSTLCDMWAMHYKFLFNYVKHYVRFLPTPADSGVLSHKLDDDAFKGCAICDVEELQPLVSASLPPSAPVLLPHQEEIRNIVRHANTLFMSRYAAGTHAIRKYFNNRGKTMSHDLYEYFSHQTISDALQMIPLEMPPRTAQYKEEKKRIPEKKKSEVKVPNILKSLLGNV